MHFECPASAAALAEYAASKPCPALPASSSSPPPSPRGAELQGLDDLESRGDGLVPQQMVVEGIPGVEEEDDEDEEMEGAAAPPQAAAAAAAAATALSS